MKNSHIQWTDDTWNPWHGCKKVSPGCKNCYMYREKRRWNQDGNKIVRSSKAGFNFPLSIKEPRRIFTCSWSDFFLQEADPWRKEAWEIIKNTPHLTYQILTKRPERVSQQLPKDWKNGYKNVWLGVSVENQDYIWRLMYLRLVPAYLRFLSAEPLLGPLTLNLEGFSWVITGGESGPDNRPAKPKWFLDIMQQCKEQKAAYFHKQNGSRSFYKGSWGGSRLEGKIYTEFPNVS